MKKITIFFWCCLFLWGTSVLAQQGFVATGGDASGTNGSVGFSIGQVKYSAVSGTNGNLIEGVQQPYEISVFVEDPVRGHSTSLYPNPTSKNITLKVDDGKWNNLVYQLFDAKGNLLLSNKVEAGETEIALSQFAAANYILKVSDNKTDIKSFKIIKLY